MRAHLNFATTDLAKSVRFYSVLLDARPAKLLHDYALFVTDHPGLELALDLADGVTSGQDAHYGVSVDSLDGVESAIARLAAAGLVSSVEREETCCYANQTKVWATDADGRRWEVYTVHEESENRNSIDAACCTSGGVLPSCCAAR
jgi:catechol 2,3-dioxygenase-like lactoylglutathione lyase family enzyme